MEEEEGINPWQVASPSPCSLAVGVSNLMSLSVAADVAITWDWKVVKALGIQPGTSLWCPSCKNTNGSIWLPSCMIIETFSVGTKMASLAGWLAGWPAGWLLFTDKIRLPSSNGVCCWHYSKRKGERKKESGHCWKGRVSSMEGRADKQKAPSVFISVTLGCSVISPLHAKQSASATEGGQRGKTAPTARGWTLGPMSVLTEQEKTKSLDRCNRSCWQCTNTIMRPKWSENVLAFNCEFQISLFHPV